MALTTLKPLPSQRVLQVASGASALVALVLGVIGSLMGSLPELRRAHALVALAFLTTSLVSALAALRYGNKAHNRSIAPLAFGVLVVGAVQYALGELSITGAHLLLGLAVILGAGGLFVRSLHRPFVVTAQGEANDDPR